MKNRHIYILFGILILCVMAAFIIWQYDLMVTTLQIIIISSLVFVLSGIIFFQIFLKDKMRAGAGQTMPAVMEMVLIYNKYFENEVTLKNSVIRSKDIIMNKKGDVNHFVAIYAPLKNEAIGGGKLLYYNTTVGDVWDIVDRPKAVEDKSIDPFRNWSPSEDPYNMPYMPQKSEDWMPLGIRKEKNDFDTSQPKEDGKK